MDPTQLIHWLTDLVATIRALPIGMHGSAVAVLVAGLLLWLVGGRLLKPALCVLGAAIGAGVGAVVIPSLGVGDLGPVPSPYLGMAGGGIVGVLAAVLLFRIAMTFCSGVVFGTLGALGAAAWLSFAPGGLPAWGGDQAEAMARARMIAASYFVQGSAPSAAGDLVPRESARQFGADVTRDARAYWDALPARSRFILAAAGLGGALLGALVGLVAPKRSAALVTALLGGAAWLGALAWLAHALRWPGQRYLDQGPVVWAAVWLIVSGVGAAIQGGARSAPMPKPPAAA